MSRKYAPIPLAKIETEATLKLTVPRALADEDTMQLAALPLAVSNYHILYPLKLCIRLWKFSHSLFALVFLLPLIGTGILEYVQLQQAQNTLYQVDALSGRTQWQHTLSTPLQVAKVDAQGSLVIISAGQHMHRLAAFNHRGVLQWQTFASAQNFFLPLVSSQPRTVLVALGKQVKVSNSEPFTLDNTASYFQPLTLYLLDRRTGHIIWQHILIDLKQQHSAAILGADTTFFYVALPQTDTFHGMVQTRTRLVAIEQATGKIAWHIATSPVQTNGLYDGGNLLVQEQHIIWQVAGTLYAITTPLGTLQWQKILEEGNLQTLVQEEFQMIETNGLLLVARSNAYHALDASSGNERWVIANPGENAATGQSIAGITAAGTTLLIYGGGQIQAINVLNKKVLWSQKQLDAIQSLSVSDDGTLVYATITDSIEGGSPVQALVALTIQNGAARWTFQPSDATTFLPLQPNGVLYKHSLLLTMTCTSTQRQTRPCSEPWLYALNAATGNILWKHEGNSIDNVHSSADGKTVLFQSNSTAWLNLMQNFRN